MSLLGLEVLGAQLDSIAAILKEAGARIEAVKVSAQAAERDAEQARQAAGQVREPEPPPPADNPNRIVPIPEAARLSSLSVDTLNRNHRDKFVRLSERRFGMRLRDALMLKSED